MEVGHTERSCPVLDDLPCHRQDLGTGRTAVLADALDRSLDDAPSVARARPKPGATA